MTNETQQVEPLGCFGPGRMLVMKVRKQVRSAPGR
jgi:hypothetical protein